MKLFYLLVLAVLFSAFSSHAQNTFPATGNVGIGTTSPQASLDVKGNIQLSSALLPMGVMTELPGTGTPLVNLSLNFRETNKNINYVGGAMRIDSRSDSPLFQWLARPAGSGTENTVMAILTNGYVGIGTNTPREALSVNGNIRSKSIKVELANWPDYVFKKDYPLPSLADVKAYIDENQHLPDMPSEAEIAKDGLNLGEMNKLLLKKVEELTLYLIEKDKEVKAQSQNNYTLETKLKIQQEQIDRLNKKMELLADKIK
jgi:hypothetical protein